MKTKNIKLFALSVALLSTVCARPSLAASHPGVLADTVAISDRLRELGAILGNQAVILLAERVLELTQTAPATLDDPDVDDLVASARIQVEDAVAGLAAASPSSGVRSSKLTRSAGLPTPGPSAIYPGGCPDANVRFGLLAAAHVAEGVFEGTRFACEQDFPGAPNPSFLCVAPDILRVALRIAYEQVDICTVFEDLIFGQTMVDQMDHLHNDHNTHTVAFSNNSTSVQNSITARNDNLSARAVALGNALDQYRDNYAFRSNTIDAGLQSIINRTSVLATQMRERLYRTSIEQSLANYQSNPLAILLLPASYGGRLELVRDVTSETITNAIRAGVPVGTARSLLDQGNAALKKREYKVAFSFYQRAYAQAQPRR